MQLGQSGGNLIGGSRHPQAAGGGGSGEKTSLSEGALILSTTRSAAPREGFEGGGEKATYRLKGFVERLNEK